ncbi:MAG: hypothetical protein H7A23_10740 [Leptospiraceae bacterium]|nr:hypothetical protein [Leptospiraceae bacterium]MCP5495022.1 hypothetical protein [Leptospiraceae bacterium]
MKVATFKEWTLTKLDKNFGLVQVIDEECHLLQEWRTLSNSVEITDFHKQTLLKLQKSLIWGGKSWNEFELENKFISPVIMCAEIDDRTIGYFLERQLSGTVGDYELSGIVYGMIAKGFRDPDLPYFCMHEYKRSVDNQGTPDAQVLAAMLVAREQNKNQKPIYGLYIVGLIWNFIVLNGGEYCISKNYDASDDDIFEIFKMLKAVKVIIYKNLLG